ncbi:MAG: hypothetical protein NVS4B3_20900 [Gemmatimonadaceae bacterium]
MTHSRLFLCAVALLGVCPLLPAQTSASALGRSSEDSTDLVWRGRMLNGQGKQAEALVQFEQAIAESPNRFDAHLGAGTTLDHLGRYADARQHLARAIELAPPKSRVQALKAMAISYAFEQRGIDAERYERQAFDSQAAAAEWSAAAETANEVARILLESGDVDRGAEWYQRGYETALRTPMLTDTARTRWDFRWQHAQARIAARRGQPAEVSRHVAAAKALLDKGLNRDQLRFLPYLTGYVAFYGGLYGAAITDLKQADQRDPFILSLLAQAYERSGDAVRAREYYGKVMTINVHNPTNAFARPLARTRTG